MQRRGNRVVSLSVTIDGEATEIAVNKQVVLLSNAHVADFAREELGILLPVWRMWPQVMALARALRHP